MSRPSICISAIRTPGAMIREKPYLVLTICHIFYNNKIYDDICRTSIFKIFRYFYPKEFILHYLCPFGIDEQDDNQLCYWGSIKFR